MTKKNTTNITQKNKYRTTQTPLTSGDEVRCC